MEYPIKHIAFRAFLSVAFCVILGAPDIANAQTVIELLQERRHRAVADNFISELGPLPHRAPDMLPVQISLKITHGESLRPDFSADTPTFNIFKVRRIPKLGRGWFEERFNNIDWVFLGSNELASVDTTFTWKLRAMLEASYGPPTQTLTDFGHWRTLDAEQHIQFEYWFIINNEVPLVVMDTNGPFERGVVVSTDRQYLSELEEIRNALFDPLITEELMTPYVDYYYDSEYDAWYRTGFDGTDLFVESIKTSEIGNGRPVLVKR